MPRRLPSGNSSSSTGAGSKSACERGISPRRDKATIRPRWPAASSDSTRSTIVRPVPTSSAGSPLSASSATAARGVSAPRIADEARRRRPRTRSAPRAPDCRQRAQAHLRLRSVAPSSSSMCQPPSPRARARTAVASTSDAAARDGLVEDFAEIAAEQPALGKAAADRRLPLRTPREMVGLAGPGAHSFGADVEQVRRLGGRISDALPHPPAAVDQQPSAMPRRASCAARIVPEKPPPTIATGIPVRFHSRANSPGLPRPLCASHMVIHAGDGLAGGLGEQRGDHGVDDAGEARADQLGADPTAPMPWPAQLIPSERGCSRNNAVGDSPLPLPSVVASPSLLPPIILATPTGFEPVALRLGI